MTRAFGAEKGALELALQISYKVARCDQMRNGRREQANWLRRSKWDSFGGLALWQATSRRRPIVDKTCVHEAERRSTFRRAGAGRFRCAAFGGRTIFSAADHCPAAGAGLRRTEASAETATGQGEAF